MLKPVNYDALINRITMMAAPITTGEDVMQNWKVNTKKFDYAQVEACLLYTSLYSKLRLRVS